MSEPTGRVVLGDMVNRDKGQSVQVAKDASSVGSLGRKEKLAPDR